MRAKSSGDPFLDSMMAALIAEPVKRTRHPYRRKRTEADVRRMTLIDAALIGWVGEWVGDAAELECRLKSSPFHTEYRRQVLRKPIGKTLLRLSISFPERVSREGLNWRIKPIPLPA